MKRMLMKQLEKWKNLKKRKPILLRGARQVGKSYLIREFGKQFENYFEINFERDRALRGAFKDSLSPFEILKKLNAFFGKKIEPEKSLLFFDEIQECQNAITSLRYFYEELPELHVIGAGSLLEFSVEKEGIPVGRVQSYYLYPMSFLEFLIAKGKENLIEIVLTGEVNEFEHNLLLNQLYEYMSVGGMPEAVKSWIENEDISEVKNIHNIILDTYIQDFNKYAKRRQIEYVEKVFSSVPAKVGKKFIFSHVDENIKTYKIKEALELLSKAMVFHKIYHSSCNGLPLEAGIKPSIFKTIFLDVGLMQTLLGEHIGLWLINGGNMLINKGQVVEAFIGQEILAYSNSRQRKKLFYWLREKRGAKAEVDYVEMLNGKIVPIEVKAGKKRYGKSIRLFMNEKKVDSGIIFYNGIPLIKNGINLYPHYYTIKLFSENHSLIF